MTDSKTFCLPYFGELFDKNPLIKEESSKNNCGTHLCTWGNKPEREKDWLSALENVDYIHERELEDYDLRPCDH